MELLNPVQKTCSKENCFYIVSMWYSMSKSVVLIILSLTGCHGILKIIVFHAIKWILIMHKFIRFCISLSSHHCFFFVFFFFRCYAIFIRNFAIIFIRIGLGYFKSSIFQCKSCNLLGGQSALSDTIKYVHVVMYSRWYFCNTWFTHVCKDGH